MSACRGNLEGALGVFLSPHIRKIHRVALGRNLRQGNVSGRAGERHACPKELDDARQRFGAQHLHPLHHRGLGHVGLWNDDAFDCRMTCSRGDAQRSSDRPDVALESQLPHHDEIIESRETGDT